MPNRSTVFSEKSAGGSTSTSATTRPVMYLALAHLVGRRSASSSITKSSRPGTVVSIYCTAGKRRRFIKQARSRQLATPQGSAPRPPRHTRHNLQAEGDPPPVWLLVFTRRRLTVSRERDMSRTPVATASQFCFQKTSPPHYLPCFHNGYRPPRRRDAARRH